MRGVFHPSETVLFAGHTRKRVKKINDSLCKVDNNMYLSSRSELKVNPWQERKNNEQVNSKNWVIKAQGMFQDIQFLILSYFFLILCCSFFFIYVPLNARVAVALHHDTMTNAQHHSQGPPHQMISHDANRFMLNHSPNSPVAPLLQFRPNENLYEACWESIRFGFLAIVDRRYMSFFFTFCLCGFQ